MATWTRFGQLRDEDRPARELVLVEAAAVADLEDWQKLTSKHFVCLVVWDVPDGDREPRQLAKRLLGRGAVYVAAFGHGCERVERAVDEVEGKRWFKRGDEHVIMTSSHAEESLDEALWQTLFAASPAQVYEATTRAIVIIAIGAPGHAHALHRHLTAPERFSERHLLQQPRSDHPRIADPDICKAADGWWSRDFACSPGALRPRQTQVQQHAGTRVGDPGIWMLSAGGCPLVSLPPDLMLPLGEVARTWTSADLADPEGLCLVVEERSGRRVERVVGPAFIGYWSWEMFDPAEDNPTCVIESPAVIERLKRACSAQEWAHGGPHEQTAATFGILDAAGEARVLAGYEIWSDELAHLQIITHPAHRGRGLGKSAVAFAAEHASNRGLIPQYRTLRGNAPSMQIARHLGFLDYGSSLYIRLAEGRPR